MTDQRDPRIKRVVVEFADSGPEKHSVDEPETPSGSGTSTGQVRLIDQPSPPARRTAPSRLSMAAAAVGVLFVFAGAALLFRPVELGTPSLLLQIDGGSTYEWHRVAHDEAAFGSRNQRMASVTKGGPGLVAVGSADIGSVAAVWTSSDGIQWSRVPHDDDVFSGASMLSVTVGGPGLVAVGSGLVDDSSHVDAVVWTSVDGITWSRVPRDEARLGVGHERRMKSVVAGGPGLVAVGSDGSAAAVWTSVDGITWSRVPHDDVVFGSAEGDGEGMNSVTVGGPGLVAVGSNVIADPYEDEYATLDVVVWTSVDGVTWSRVPDDEAVFGGDGHQLVRSVTAGGPGLVAVGLVRPLLDNEDGSRDVRDIESDAAVWTSVDGISWTRVAHDEEVFGSDAGTGTGMTSVIAGGPGLVAVGGLGGPPDDLAEMWRLIRSVASVWTSVDGITWVRDTSVEDAFGGEMRGTGMWSVTVGGPGLVAVGSVDVSVGVDGAAWVAVPNG